MDTYLSGLLNGRDEGKKNRMTSRGDGMLSMDESVRQLLRAGQISRATAEQNVRDPTLLGA